MYTGETKGRIYYDFKNKAELVQRENGQYDRYCGSTKPLQDTPCTHIVNKGQRYLHFPKLNICCKCCTDKQGCGVVRPDWLLDSKLINEYTRNGVEYMEYEK